MHKKNMIMEIEAIENAVTMVYIWLDYMPERIYNSHHGNGVPAMFTS